MSPLRTVSDGENLNGLTLKTESGKRLKEAFRN